MAQVFGSFTLNVTARFDGLGYGIGQTVLDIGDSDSIMLVQSGASTTMKFVIFVDCKTTVWTVAVDEGSVMSIENGGAQLAQRQADVPVNVLWPFALLGEAKAALGTLLKGDVSVLFYSGEDIVASGPVQVD